MHQASSRVYYSCECKLRGWVPGPVYSLLTKEALKKATVWVERESLKEYRSAGFKFSVPFNGDAIVANIAKVREAVASKVGELKLPALPAMPELPVGLPQLPFELPGRKPADALAEGGKVQAKAMRFRPAFIPGRVTAMPKRRAAFLGSYA